MYHAIVARRTNAVWRRINERDVDAPWRMADEQMRFTFVGDTPLRADLTGRDAFRDWLRGAFVRFPDLRFTVLDVAVAGGPQRTRVSVRLRIEATLVDGSRYENFATQWLTLRWGRMTEDWVLEDTAALSRACVVQDGAPVSSGHD
ncbi:MAG: hypothetical protein JWL83_739 [Actinomycetia bacterium]|nr:hypothetical protein [Actinomycetes bacterium]